MTGSTSAEPQHQRLNRSRRASSSSPPPPRQEEEEEEGEEDVGLDSVKKVTPSASVLPEGIVTTTMKRKKTRATFTIDDLMKAEGIEWLRDNMPKLAKFDRKDDASDARRLVRHYKGWCSRLFPSLPFDEMVSRIEKFGSKARLRNAMEKFRTDQFWNGKKKERRDDEGEPAPPATTEKTTSVAEMIAAKREAALAIRREKKRQLAEAAREKENEKDFEEKDEARPEVSE